MNRKLAPRWPAWALGLTLSAIGGCGSNAPLPPAVEPPRALPVPVAAAPANNAPANPKGNTKAGANAKGKAAPPLPFPNESRENVLEVVTTAEPMTTEVAPRFAENEKFVVAAGVMGLDSTQFTGVGKGNSVGSHAAASTFKLPDGFTALPDFGTGDDGAPLRIHCKKDDSVMALVSAGTSIVGTDSGPTESQPSFTVFTDAFYMDVTEVTATQFEKYREELRKDKKRVPPPPINANAGEGWPVLGVSWGDAQNFLRWLGKELPTEAEYEKAARGPNGFAYPWGNGRPVWNGPRTPKTLVSVGSYVGDQSPYGIYDLAGNAREWTADFYRPTAHADAADQAANKSLRNWTGPKTAASGSQRVIKGGGDDWAVWHRSAADMSALLPDVSFRGVLRVSSIKSGSTNSEEAKPKTKAAAPPKTGF